MALSGGGRERRDCALWREQMGFHLLLGFSADSQPLKSWGSCSSLSTVLDLLLPGLSHWGGAAGKRFPFPGFDLTPRVLEREGHVTRETRLLLWRLIHPWLRCSLQGRSWPGAHLYLFLTLPAYWLGFRFSDGVGSPIDLRCFKHFFFGERNHTFLIGKFLS